MRDAIDKLQKALTPSVVLDRELDARRNDAAKVASGAAYKSPYHDAHHATIVAASALLGRALGEGGVGTGFVYGAETMVRDALLMIEGAARDALRRDEGELPRLFDIAEGMRKRRDDAGGRAGSSCSRSRDKTRDGIPGAPRLRDAVAQAKAQSTRETEQEKARLAKEHESMREELELMQRQLIAARDASSAQIVQLSKQVQHERNARGGDALEHQQTGEHVRAKLEMAEVKIADLANQLRNAQRSARSKRRGWRIVERGFGGWAGREGPRGERPDRAPSTKGPRAEGEVLRGVEDQGCRVRPSSEADDGGGGDCKGCEEGVRGSNRKDGEGVSREG